MGVYHINTDKEQMLTVIRQFACEEGLGQPQVEYTSDSLFNVHASAGGSFNSSRCFWVCERSNDGVVVKIRVLPSLPKTIQIYASFSLIAVGLSLIGCLFTIKDLAGVFHHIELLLAFLGFAFLGLFLYLKTRYTKINLVGLSIERRFFERLKPFSPLIKKTPEHDILSLSTCIVLIYTPILLLIFGLMRTVPLLAIPATYCFTVLMIYSIGGMADRKPHTQWRVILLGWISKWAVIFFMAFLGIAFFSFFSAVISCLHRGQQAKESDFFESIKHPVWRTPAEFKHSNVFATNAACFKDLIAKNNFDENQATMVAQITRLVLVCLSLALLIWGVLGLADWVRAWITIDPRTRPKLSPPPASIYDQSLHISSLPILPMLLSGGIGNLFNFALAIEILSVLILGHAAFNYTIAQTICWIAIDFKAAALGRVQASFIGVCFLLIIMLPTLITVTIWILVLTCSQIGRLKRMLFPSKEYSLIDMVNTLSFAFGLRPPVLCVVKSRNSFFTTMVPWLFGRPYLLVSRVALESLNKTELESAIAHELAHVKYDGAIIRLTQWVSFFSWFPCNAFGLLIDTEGREMRADEEAANIVGSSEAVALALVKMCVNQVNFQGGNEKVTTSEKTGGIFGPLMRRWYSAVGYVSLFRPLFWPEFIFGYAHPAVQDRLATLYTSKAIPHNN